MIVEYLENSFSENEKEEILNSFRECEICFFCKKPEIRQAAFDELFGQVVIFLSSNEVTAFVNGIALIGSIVKAINFIVKKTKQKKFTKITINSQSVCPMNVIIQIDNIKILQPETSNDEYLSVALITAVSPSIPKDEEIIISFDNTIRIETIEEYVYRKMKIKKGNN